MGFFVCIQLFVLRTYVLWLIHWNDKNNLNGFKVDSKPFKYTHLAVYYMGFSIACTKYTQKI